MAARRSTERGSKDAAENGDLERPKLCLGGTGWHPVQGYAAISEHTRYRAPRRVGCAAGIRKIPCGDQRGAGPPGQCVALEDLSRTLPVRTREILRENHMPAA